MKKMDIIYEDKELLVINKPPHYLTISTEKETTKTLYHEARTYLKKQNPQNKIFIVHRLDKETSGIVIFAKSNEKKQIIQDNWSNTERMYYAIVEGTMPKEKDTLKSYLIETKTLEVHSTKDKRHGKLAITEYEVLKTNKKYSLLRIKIITGRRNQIRVQLSDINHPILGDKKYHSKENPLKRLALHAYYLEIKKPHKYIFTTPYPKEFKKIFDL